MATNEPDPETARDSDRAGTDFPIVRRNRPQVTDPIQRKARRPLPDFTGLPAPPEDADPAFHEFLPAVLQIVYTPPSRWRRVVGYLVCSLIVGAFAWSIFGYLRLFAIAPGEIQVRGGSQVVQAVEAGPVAALPVHEGSHVLKGSIVLQIDPTAATAAKTIVESNLANARAESVRHRTAAALAQADPIDPNGPIAWAKETPADVRAREETVLHADLTQLAAVIADYRAKLKSEETTRDKYVANISAQKILIDSRTKRAAMHETLAEKGWDSRATVLQALEPLRKDEVSLANYQGALEEAKKAIPVIESQIVQARQSFIADNIDAAASAERQVAELNERLKMANLALVNLSLRAPATGTVRALTVTNLGQSIGIGEKVMQIVPDGAALDIQAYVLNTDIGFVKAGQPVTIKVDTFPYTRYGTIDGYVTHVGADAITGKYAVMQQKDDSNTPSKGALSVTNPAQQVKDLVFPVTVAPKRSSMQIDGRDTPLTAGMSVVVEIETQRQRAIFYIFHPLTRFLYGGPAGG